MDNQTRNHLNLQKHIADQDHIIRVRNAEIAALRKRAEKAEKERDQNGALLSLARDALAATERQRDEARSALRARLGVIAEPRPLTPDAITDDMVERALQVNSDLLASTVHRMLTAALTESPTRPEGAEDVEALIEESLSGDALSDAQVRALADFLVERGVRVAGGN